MIDFTEMVFLMLLEADHEIWLESMREKITKGKIDKEKEGFYAEMFHRYSPFKPNFIITGACS